MVGLDLVEEAQVLTEVEGVEVILEVEVDNTAIPTIDLWAVVGVPTI
jgi:hypothetical protein